MKDCSIQNMVYYILCGCVNEADYVGFTKGMKPPWSKHKYDIRNSNWTELTLEWETELWVDNPFVNETVFGGCF